MIHKLIAPLRMVPLESRFRLNGTTFDKSTRNRYCNSYRIISRIDATIASCR